MTNKFRRISPQVHIPEDERERPEFNDLTIGALLDRSPRRLPPGASPNLGHIRFDEGALRKDFGSTAIGAAAPAKILGIGEHKYVLQGASFHRLIRLRRAAGKLVLDIWDGADWVEEATSAEDVPDVYLSLASTLDRFLIADGTQILTWHESLPTGPAEDDFVAGNSLTAPGDEVDAIISPAGAVDDEYNIRFSVDLTINNGSGYTVTVALLHEGVEVLTRDFELDAGTDAWVDELFELVADIADLETLTLQVKSVTADSIPASTLAWTDPGATHNLEATKASAVEAQDDTYEFRFIYNNSGASSSGIIYYADFGAGWVQIDAQTLTPADDGDTISNSILIPGAGAGTKFAVEAAPNGDGVQDASPPLNGEGVRWFAIDPAVDYDLIVHGYNKAVDADAFSGVEYEVELPPDSFFELLSDEAPGARFILPFGDRLLAYRNEGDHQVASWSADGLLETWDPNGPGDAGSTVLVDTRSDGIDDLMGAAVLSAGMVAVFRKRSIMRAQETGNVALAMAHYHWIEKLGTESPFSIQSTPFGILFLGHDLQVYLLTEGGPNPVGAPIHGELIRRVTSNQDLVDSAYDSVFGEYYLGVPEDNASEITAIWILNFRRLLEEQHPEWRYRPGMAIQRFGHASVVE